MTRILITAFDPFGGQNINASQEVLKHLNINFNDIVLDTLVLPTVFKTVEDIISAKIDYFKPDVILLLGEAGGTHAIRLERIAINIDDARIPDNNHDQPIDQKIKTKGENALFSTLPIKDMLKVLNDHDIPAVISNSAGTFVCNHLMYITLHYIKHQIKKPTKVGFIHFPRIESQIKDLSEPHLPLSTSIKALEYMINTCL